MLYGVSDQQPASTAVSPAIPQTARRGKEPRARRGEVIDVAARVFHERGYRATTIRDIAAELGFTSAALYYYVGSKQDLLVEISEQAGARLLESLTRISSLEIPVIERLRLLIHEHLELLIADRAIFSVMLQERSELPTEQLAELERGERSYSRLLRQMVAEGVANGELQVRDVRVTTLALLGMLNWALRWYRPDGALSLREIGDTFFDIVTAGISARGNVPPART